MSKIVMMMSVSVDGYFAGPEGELDWHLVDDELHAHFNELLRGMAAFLGGRVTFELMAGFWPAADEDPASTATMGGSRALAGDAEDRVLPHASACRVEHHGGPGCRARGGPTPGSELPPTRSATASSCCATSAESGPVTIPHAPSLTHRPSRSVPHAPSLTRSRLDLAGGTCSPRSGSRPRCPPWTSQC